MDKAQDISLTLVRKIKASPEKVFAAWTDPEVLKKWMSPSDDMEVTLAETNLKVGGRYRIIMHGPDGKDHIVGGTYSGDQSKQQTGIHLGLGKRAGHGDDCHH